MKTGEIMNKDTVAFTNAGLIDSRMWSTFGVSVKETDSAIGQFGTQVCDRSSDARKQVNDDCIWWR